jgi:hypothetical protein
LVPENQVDEACLIVRPIAPRMLDVLDAPVMEILALANRVFDRDLQRKSRSVRNI